ncbi:NYN domain-containing protein [Planktotalea sp.]|uniref:NYN domain-containing protein n=1 Tax=Planktotalea sp. TaxID=2029877 RepID=UPI003D6AE455
MLASLWLLWRGWGRRSAPRSAKTRNKRAAKSPRARSRTGTGAQNWIVVDGSNVMHWRGEPNIRPVKDVIKNLERRGFTVGVMFDANAGYKLIDRHQNDDAFSRLLGLPEERIMVVPSGTPADPYILTAARDMGAQIVTNDRFRDWADTYPEVRAPGFLITGNYRNKRLHLSID